MKFQLPIALAMAYFAAHAEAQAPRTYALDPFAQATSGDARCPAVTPPVLDASEMRAQAHSRAERGTSCCLAGTCECGGPYRHDPEINDRVVDAIRRDRRFRETSVWATTTRGFVTLQGCVHDTGQKDSLSRLAKRQPGVVLVWNETKVGKSRK